MILKNHLVYKYHNDIKESFKLIIIKMILKNHLVYLYHNDDIKESFSLSLS